MKKINSEIKIGIVAILSIIVLVWGLNFLKGTSVFSNNVFYYSIYSDVAGMDISAPVRINGFNIGKVTDVYFHPNNSGKLVVKFELDNDFKIPINSIATIYNTDLMGTKAIKLVLGNSMVYASKGDTLYSYSEGDLKDEVNKQVLPLKNKAEDLISSIDSVMTVITTVLDKDARSSLTNSLYSLNRTFSTMELAMLKIDSMIYYNDNRVSNILSNIESISSNIHNNNELISSILKNFESISDDEDVTRSLGINVSHYKIFAFVIGTSVAGVAGALYAHHLRFIGPDSFGFVESVSVLAMVIIGGVGSVWAVSITAAFLSVLPMVFQFVDDYKLLFYSALLFFMMRFSPEGLKGLVEKIKKNRKSKLDKENKNEQKAS